MLRTIVLIAIVFVTTTVVVAVPQYSRCPSQCNCDTPVIQCDDLEIKKFGTKVYVLKVVNPKKPLLLKENIFVDMGISNVHTLYIENARIQEIHRNAFTGLEALRSLSLINCEISPFNLDAIDFPASLEKLSFSGTPIKRFHLNLGSLSELNLSNCNLTFIPENMFDGVSKLSYINLSNNKIDTIDELALSNLINLNEINFSKNKLTKIPFGLFNVNEELVHIDFSDNPLHTINIKFPEDLEKLVLRNCELVEFDRLNLDLLSMLDLSQNKLTSLGNLTFAGMPELLYIDLSFNSITSLEHDVFMNNPKLQKILLNENKMDKLPKFVAKSLFATSEFSCNNCDISVLDNDVFSNMPAIVILRLSGNEIEVIHSTFQSLHALTYLDLSENAIEEINKDAFKYNSALQTLNLSGNSLSEIRPDWFENNKVLKELDVSENGLVTIWKQLLNKKIPSLLILNAAHNRITRILIEDLNVMPNIHVLNISSNAIDCNSQFQEAIEWLENNNVLPGQELTKMPMLNSNGPEVTLSRQTWICDKNEMEDAQDDIYDDYNEYNFGKTPIKIDDDGLYENKDNDRITYITEASTIFTKTYKYQYFWPVLVFFVTACLVLIVAANVILLILRKKGSIAPARPIQMPRVKILPLLTSSKVKKHSGTVYRPLSEENIDTRSNYSVRTDVPHTNLL